MLAPVALLCVLGLLSVSAQESQVTVSLPGASRLTGLNTTTVRGVRYYSFRGVPYAAPPVGSLRLKDPVPYTGNGTVQALADAPQCPQVGGGQEDCLYLNVYTRQVPQLDGSQGRAAVMVFLHGGALRSGSGDSQTYGPDFLLEVDGVVIVTLNYRLGALGFLSTQDAVIRGNYGFKDQTLALRWVRHNIAALGGNPDRVTLFGESAGSVSVSYHLLSPLSTGLFQRAIMQSSCVLSPRGVAHTARDRAFRLARAVGYRGANSSEQLLAFLQAANATELVSDDNMALSDEDRRRFSTFSFLGVVEQPWAGAFLPDAPLRLLQTGRFNRVPLIAGFNSAEGLMTVERKGVFRSDEAMRNFDSGFIESISLDVIVNDKQYQRDAAQKIRKFYLNDGPIHAQDFYPLVDLISDLYYVEPVDMLVRMLSNLTTNLPVYEYLFDYKGENSEYPMYRGVTHADELKLLFYVPKMKQNLNQTSVEDMTRRKMIALWTNFAKTGDPTPAPLDGVTWLPYGSPRDRRFLVVNATGLAGRDVFGRRLDFLHALQHPPSAVPAPSRSARLHAVSWLCPLLMLLAPALLTSLL